MNCDLENSSDAENEEQSDVNAVESTRLGTIVRDQVKNVKYSLVSNGHYHQFSWSRGQLAKVPESLVQTARP
jgi:hypothetical protein